VKLEAKNPQLMRIFSKSLQLFPVVLLRRKCIDIHIIETAHVYRHSGESSTAPKGLHATHFAEQVIDAFLIKLIRRKLFLALKKFESVRISKM
jgi:hypothetical protein